MGNRMNKGLRVLDRSLLHQIGPELPREVELRIDVQSLGDVDASVASLWRIVQLTQRRVARAGVVPRIGVSCAALSNVSKITIFRSGCNSFRTTARVRS
jgi:hypothetical protein